MVKARCRRALAILRLSPAGHRDELDVLKLRARSKCAGQFAAIHLRHAQIQEGDGGRFAFGLDECRRAIVSRAHDLSLQAQQHGEAVGGVFIVINDEHAARRKLRLLVRRLAMVLPVPVSVDDDERQANDELAAGIAAGAVRFDRAAMQFDEPLHERQANAQTALRFFRATIRLIEHIEQARQRVARDANAGISHPDDPLLACSHGADKKLAATFGILRRVVEQESCSTELMRLLMLCIGAMGRPLDCEAVTAMRRPGARRASPCSEPCNAGAKRRVWVIVQRFRQRLP
jgi:hypothetical protein